MEGDTLTRLRRECPKCEKGTFMAVHKGRISCGSCGYTEFIKKDAPKKAEKKPGKKADLPDAPADATAPSLLE